LQSGKDDVEKMQEIYERAGGALADAGRILELGCAGGRMIRFLEPIADSCEIWGTDIWASAIIWCQQNLSPPFHFVTTTVGPHLPFEDRYFGFIYAGSVFTHIDDLADAWFLELRRILRPGGRLYITIMDRSSVAIFDGQLSEAENEQYCKKWAGKARWEQFKAVLSAVPEYQQFKRGEANMVTYNRPYGANVLWDADFLCKRLQPFYRALSINPKAYGPQTGVMLERV
jgi:SAM-dependent methyltransferase